MPAPLDRCDVSGPRVAPRARRLRSSKTSLRTSLAPTCFEKSDDLSVCNGTGGTLPAQESSADASGVRH